MSDTGNTLENRLKQLRDEIDSIDSEIVGLINKRLRVGRKIGKIKRESKSNVFDPSREKKVMEKITRMNDGPAENKLLRYIFNVIMMATKDIQKTRLVSYLGPEAGYSHIASLNYFKHSGNFRAQPNIYEVFKDVNKGTSHYGVIPVENTIEGAVTHTLDLFMEFDLKICGEQYEPVSYDLISGAGEAELVETIYCHPQAFSQCEMWIQRMYPDARIIEVGSTARASAMAAEDEHAAVVSSSQSAHIYNLQTVESSIEDYPGNITRFLVISREVMEKTGQDKTSIMFATSHTPGSLFQALEPLDKAGINMVKLESRPAKYHNWSYCFFMDIEGHMDDPAVYNTLEKMRKLCLSLKILGSYPICREEEPF